MDNSKTENSKPRRKLRPITLVMTVMVICAAFAYGNEWMTLKALQEKQVYYQAVYEGLQAENAQLVETVGLLGDETYMERLARERCKLIKPGEYLLVPAETNDEVEEYAGVDITNLH